MIGANFSALRRRFQEDARGNVAMMVAVSIVPLTLASLGALDLTRAVSDKVALQDALDAAALAAGRSTTTDPSQLQAIGQRVLVQNLAGTKDITLVSSSFTFGANGTIEAQAQASFQPSMSGLFGSGNVLVSTQVTRASDILEIAMVLDNTLSMNETLGGGDTKISALRTAAANFVDTMSKAAGQSSIANSVQISLVPFANVVNVGKTYRYATWIDQNGDSPINNEIFTTAQGVVRTDKTPRFDLFAKLGVDWAGCVEMRKAPYDVQDTPPAASTPATLFTPFFAPDEVDADTGGGYGGGFGGGMSSSNDYVKDPAPKTNSKGKVTSDWWYAQGDVAKYSSKPKVKLDTSTGPNKGCSVQPIQRLTTDFAGLKTAIKAMTPVGETDIPLGLEWGWLTLSPNEPFGDGVAYDTPKHKKIVVLMTDGQDTMYAYDNNNNNSVYSSAGYVWQGRFLDADGKPLTLSSSQDQRSAAMDSRLQLLCKNMKTPGVDVEIYTVGVGVTSYSASLLRSCASGVDHYFDVTSTSNLNATFQNIANSIAQLHLSK